MAIPTPPRQVINNGAFLSDPSAESIYTAWGKANLNFSNIWSLLENQGYEKIRLDLNGIDTEQQELKYIADAIERGRGIGGGVYGGVWTITPIGRKPLFYTITPSGTNNFAPGTPNPNLSYDYRFYRVHKAGQVFGGSGGVFITSEDVSPAGSFIVGGFGENPNLYINLGDIGTANVWTQFNLGDPDSDPIYEPWTIAGIKNVYAIQNGVSRTWSFTGNQRLGIDEGEWGGSDVISPDYLAAVEDDFDLLSNQPTVYPDLFVTKSSKKYRDYTLTSGSAVEVFLTPEYTTYNVDVTGGVGQIKGFNSSTLVATYDGMDIYFKNVGANDLTLLHNDGTAQVPFFFKTEANVVLGTNDILHLKYNLELNVVELVGISELPNLPIPFGSLRILKKEGNGTPSAIIAGDLVVNSWLNSNIYLAMGEYVSGDVMLLASYDPATVDYTDLS